MSITITINGTAADAARSLRQFVEQLALEFDYSPRRYPAPVDPSAMDAVGEKIAAVRASLEMGGDETASDKPITQAEHADVDAAVEEAKAEQPKRGRGRPPKAKPAETAPAAAAPAEPKQDELPLISADPENRVDPAAEDSEAVAEQDAADEAAEVEANAPAEKQLTHDDLRQAMGAYVKGYGMAAAQEDGAKIFEKALGPVPTGTKNAKGDVVTSWVASAVPAEQSALKKAIDFWNAALTENPFKREKVG